jgi:hypothetical protein
MAAGAVLFRPLAAIDGIEGADAIGGSGLFGATLGVAAVCAMLVGETEISGLRVF